jgi:hypothetical protein
MTEMSFFGLGPNELWLSLHGLIFILIVGFASYTFGGIYFTKDPTPVFVTRLKFSALVTFILTFVLMISGILPDTNFGNATMLTAAYSSSYGNFTQNVGAVAAGNFTGPLLFDMMEHISFVGLALVGVITYLVWDFGALVVTDGRVRMSVLSIIFVTVAWLIVLGVVGTLLTKTLTFPPGT